MDFSEIANLLGGIDTVISLSDGSRPLEASISLDESLITSQSLYLFLALEWLTLPSLLFLPHDSYKGLLI